MFRPVWSAVVSDSYQHLDATLSGFVRRSILHEDYPAIIADRIASEINGVLYLDISSADFKRLDEFEGSIYKRQLVQVRTIDNLYAADTYVLRPEYRHLLSNKQWNPADFQEAGMHRFLDYYSGFDR